MPGPLAYEEDADIIIKLSTQMSPSFESLALRLSRTFKIVGFIHDFYQHTHTQSETLAHFAVRPGRVSLQNASTSPFPNPDI